MSRRGRSEFEDLRVADEKIHADRPHEVSLSTGAAEMRILYRSREARGRTGDGPKADGGAAGQNRMSQTAMSELSWTGAVAGWLGAEGQGCDWHWVPPWHWGKHCLPHVEHPPLGIVPLSVLNVSFPMRPPPVSSLLCTPSDVARTPDDLPWEACVSQSWVQSCHTFTVFYAL